MSRPPKQEQEPASSEVIEVAPGVLRMQLPIMFPGLAHVNCYALEDKDGFAIVDPGMPGPDSYKALKTRLRSAGSAMRHVHTVVITHSHPDHFGGAGRVARDAGAKIVTSKQFRTWWDPDEPDTDIDAETVGDSTSDDADSPRRPFPFAGPTPWGGAPPEPPKAFQSRRGRRRARRWFLTPTPTDRLDDADVTRLAGRDWVAIHTPGHTADHLCLLDRENGVLLAGDHVLPTITPHISGLGGGPDPLADFFVSLDRVAALPDVTNVLPAHGHPFTDLAGRVDHIKRHHDERLAKLRDASDRLGEASVQDYMRELFRERSWGTMAESETYAHLEHLRIDGRAESRGEGGRLLYSIG